MQVDRSTGLMRDCDWIVQSLFGVSNVGAQTHIPVANAASAPFFSIDIGLQRFQ